MNNHHNTIHIRPAVPGDIAVLTMLLELLFTIETDFVFDSRKHQRGLRLLIDAQTACVLVAETDGRVIGMCSGQITISTAEGGQALLVEDVVVHGDHRGHGIGTRLLDALDKWAAARGIARLQLLADRNNKGALGFYHRLGWRTTRLITLRKILGENNADRRH